MFELIYCQSLCYAAIPCALIIALTSTSSIRQSWTFPRDHANFTEAQTRKNKSVRYFNESTSGLRAEAERGLPSGSYFRILFAVIGRRKVLRRSGELTRNNAPVAENVMPGTKSGPPGNGNSWQISIREERGYH